MAKVSVVAIVALQAHETAVTLLHECHLCCGQRGLVCIGQPMESGQSCWKRTSRQWFAQTTALPKALHKN